MHAGSTLAITDPNKAKGIIYMPEHLTHSQNGLTQLIKIFTMGWHQRRTLCSHFKNRQSKAAFIGDSSLVEDRSPKYLREDNGKPKNVRWF